MKAVNAEDKALFPWFASVETYSLVWYGGLVVVGCLVVSASLDPALIACLRFSSVQYEYWYSAMKLDITIRPESRL